MKILVYTSKFKQDDTWAVIVQIADERLLGKLTADEGAARAEAERLEWKLKRLFHGNTDERPSG